MSNLTPLKVMKLLDQGHELCGICGKIITGKPDCVHNETTISSSTQELNQGFWYNQLNPRSMRIGEEFLALYPDQIKTLPCVDNYAVLKARVRYVLC